MTWKRIPVRIRSDDEIESHSLGECSAGDLSSIPELVQQWGYEGAAGSVSAQFTAIGFEIVVHESDDV